MAKILIVEDETSLVELYKEILIEAGHEVYSASDGEAGLSLARTVEWQVLFLDIMLPKLDGFEVLKRLHSEGLTESRSVVMLTNLANEEVVKESLKFGAKEYINKSDITPVTVTTLVDRHING